MIILKAEHIELQGARKAAPISVNSQKAEHIDPVNIIHFGQAADFFSYNGRNALRFIAIILKAEHIELQGARKAAPVSVNS